MRKLELLGRLALIASCASGQWLNYPAPRIPRLPDGKPNLTAPARRLPIANLTFQACGTSSQTGFRQTI